jgi:FlaA1/EpsC-like NDP-sugar epimerase
VIPLFLKQIQQKREITVTDRSMSRFMMTLQQATELTIKAMQVSHGGEIFVLKMPVICLQDLADIVIRNAARRYFISPNEVSIREIGLRPGEKMYEELMTEDEALYALELKDMFIIPNRFLENDYVYEDATPASQQSYNSHSVPAISLDLLEKMIHDNRLLDSETEQWGVFES